MSRSARSTPHRSVVVIFLRWSTRSVDDDRAYRRHRPGAEGNPADSHLTYEDVKARFDASEPAPMAENGG